MCVGKHKDSIKVDYLSLGRLQDTKSVYKNHMYVYILGSAI